MSSYSQKTVRKSAAWHKHGKHAKVDPFYYRNERKRRMTEWFGSVGELFRGRSA